MFSLLLTYKYTIQFKNLFLFDWFIVKVISKAKKIYNLFTNKKMYKFICMTYLYVTAEYTNIYQKVILITFYLNVGRVNIGLVK